METAVINIKVDAGFKKDAQKFAKDIGTSLSSLITMLLQDAIRKKSVTFSVPTYKMTPYLESEIAKSKAEIARGEYDTFDNVDDFIKSLENIPVSNPSMSPVTTVSSLKKQTPK